MTPERWRAVEALFHEAMAEPQPRRAELVRQRANGDPALRAEVESLLAAAENDPGSLLRFREPAEGPADESVIGEPQEATTIAREGPHRLGRYRIVTKLGAGGMGDVYIGEDELLQRRVAVKVIASKLASDADRIARFRREARAIAQLDHPNIVTIYDYGTEGDLHYFVTEYVSGTTLRELIRRSECSRRKALEIAIAVASALAAVHTRAIAHRDVKPDNILIDDHGHVKVIDFGIAKLLESPGERRRGDDATPTRSGTLIGTIDYMAPEQVRGEVVDGSADIFSFGVVLYELLSGRRPFVGPTSQDVMAAILLNEPPPLHSAIADPPLAQLIESMLAKDRQARPTAAEILGELQSLLREPHVRTVEDPVRPVRSETWSTNLPYDTAPLLGRENEIAGVIRLLQQPQVRLLTLTGSAGIGKTRVAVAAARSLAEHFPAGVWFVGLESARDPGLVGSLIADSVGVAETKLRDRLRHERALLVIDNFEHVADAAPQIAALITGTEWLKVLVTSQAPLHLRAEHEYSLNPLVLPDERGGIETVATNAAVMMFVDRARAVRPDFELTEENGATVAAICRAVGGLPLAIELAAARVRVLAPAAILEGLRDPLDFLTGGPRDMPDRQRTLRSAIEWSVGLLDEQERQFFRLLSIFEGGWTAESCRDVVGNDAAHLLNALVEKSLVRRLPSAAEERFGMLDAIRRLAASQMGDSPERRREIADRHLQFFEHFSQRAVPHLVGAGQPLWAARLTEEEPNFRAALRHAVESRQPAVGLRLATSLWKFWDVRSRYDEGRAWLAQLLAIGADVDPAVRWAGWYAAGVLADAQGDYEAAYSSFREQLAICRKLDDRWALASAINNVAIAALRLGRLEDAGAHHAESLSLWRSLENPSAVALSLQNLGHVERARGATEAARDRYRESAATFRALGDRRGAAISMTCLADIDRDQNRLDDAITQYEEALQIFMALTDHWQVARCMADYGEARRRAKQPAEARPLLVESALIFREVGDPRSGAEVLERLALLAADDGDAEKALELGAAAAAAKRRLGLRQTSPGFDSAMDRARAAAGERAQEAWQQGWGMSFDEAVDLAQSPHSRNN